MSQPVCLITGVGDGTGAAIARRFSQSNYQVAMVARNRDRLVLLESELPNTKAYVCDVGDLQGILATIEAVRAAKQIPAGSQMGNPSVLIHNAVRVTFGNFLEADPEDLAQWREAPRLIRRISVGMNRQEIFYHWEPLVLKYFHVDNELHLSNLSNC